MEFSREEILNRTSFPVDAEELLAQEMDVHLPAGSPQILILHTHGTEAFTADGEHPYTPSDAYRSTDSAFNMVGLGDVLQEELEAQGLRVIHDRELYDYPSYTGAYERSADAAERALAEYPELAVIIDLHRDALGGEDRIYKTQAWIGGESTAQVMLLVGTGENGLEHPRWEENLKLALRLRRAMEAAYPGLARPIDLVQERYNQQYTTGSLIVEVGSSGNTLPEAERAVRLFARAAGPVLLSLVSEEV